MRQRICSRCEIIELREVNFRQMKLGKPDPAPCEKMTATVIVNGLRTDCEKYSAGVTVLWGDMNQ